MSSSYDATAQRALATIARKGADVLFPIAASGQVFDPATNTWSGGTPASIATGKAVAADNDTDLLSTLGLLGRKVVTLLIAATNLAIVPIANMVLTWAGVTYTMKSVDSVAPDGTPILYTVVAVA